MKLPRPAPEDLRKSRRLILPIIPPPISIQTKKVGHDFLEDILFNHKNEKSQNTKMETEQQNVQFYPRSSLPQNIFLQSAFQIQGGGLTARNPRPKSLRAPGKVATFRAETRRSISGFQKSPPRYPNPPETRSGIPRAAAA